MTKKGSQILWKPSKNRRLGLLGDFFRIFLRASWTPVPKILDFGDFWERPGVPRRPICLQLGGSRPSKIDAGTRKSRCPKITCFWHRFFKCSGFILEGFLDDFLKESSRKLWQHAVSDNLKNYYCIKVVKCILSRNRALKKNDQNAYLSGIERQTNSITLFYIQIFSPSNLARSSRVLSSSGK